MSKESSIFIKISDGDNIDRCLKRFKRLCESYGITREYRRRREYKKPCERKKEKKEAATKRRKKGMAKMSRFEKRI